MASTSTNNKQTSTENLDETQDITRLVDVFQTGARYGTETGKQTSTTQLLSPEVQAFITQNLLGQKEDPRLTQLFATLNDPTKSLADPTILAAAGAAKDNARLDFETTILPQLFRNADQIGSVNNTAVQQLNSRAGVELATRLAGIDADAAVQASQFGLNRTNAGVQGLIQAMQGQTGNITNLAQILRGATATSTQELTSEQLEDTEQLSQTEEVSTLVRELLRQIKGTMVGRTSDPIGDFSQIMGAFGDLMGGAGKMGV